jgi:hypothetical protein
MLKHYRDMHVSKKRDLWLGVLVVAGINIALLLLEVALLRGSALGGLVRAGHYYVSEKGKLTEVPFFLFRLNQFHVLVTLLTVPVVAVAYFQFQALRKSGEDYNPITPRNNI